MMTFPVNTISLLRQDGVFQDEEFARYACEHNMKWNDSNLFIDSSVTSLSNCCRLKSNIEDLGYFNSIGGTALKVGSVKVNTVNLARLALENKTEEAYLNALERMVRIDLEALDCVRTIIKRNVDKGLLKNFSLGLIDFEHLYNTVGFIGIYETMKTFKYITVDELGNTYYTAEAEQFGKKIFDTIHRVKAEFAENANTTVYFDFDSSALTAKAVADLDSQIAWLKKNPKVNVVIQGYCDKRGTAEYNLALGERRAEAVKQYLVSQGVCAKRVATVSYGKEYAFPGDTEEAYAKSRRGVTVVELSK